MTSDQMIQAIVTEKHMSVETESRMRRDLHKYMASFGMTRKQAVEFWASLNSK